jgi:cysteine desulfurase
MNQTRIYFDNAATTPLHPDVKAAMEPYWSEIYGNASSPYAVAREARMALDTARRDVAKLIGAHADEVVWTSGGTESDNWALLGTAFGNLEEKGHFIISAIEHHAVLEPAETLQRLGFTVDFARPNGQGVVEPEEIGRLLRSNTRLVSLMSVNNETGVMQPLGDVARVVKGMSDAFLHVDATQSAGKVNIDVDLAVETEGQAGIDLLTLSSHKIYGPKGVGALYIRRGTAMRPLLSGGAQERGRRAGTENVPGVVGFAAASRMALEDIGANSVHLLALRHHLEAGLHKIGHVEIVGEAAMRAPHICSFVIQGARAETLAMNLDMKGFAVGTGSACASGALEPSHVLAAMGYPAEAARSALRVSFGIHNTIEQVEEFLDAVAISVGRAAAE